LDAVKRDIIIPPISIRIKPTNRCNHNCFYCSTPERAKYVDGTLDTFNVRDYIPWDIMKDLLEDIKVMEVKSVILSGGGEPLLYKYIIPCLELIKEYNINLALITNGQLLEGQIAELLKDSKWIRISLDSPNKELFYEIRGLNGDLFDKLCSNIKNFIKIKNENCEVGINCVIHKKNYKYIYEMAELAKSLGVNHIKFTPVISREEAERYHTEIKEEIIKSIENAKELLETDTFKIFNAYKKEVKAAIKFKRTFTKCPILQISSCIGADCKVYFCHDKLYMKNNSYGSLKEKRFKDIWFSNKTAKIMKTLNPVNDCPHACVWEGRIKLINEYLNLNENDVDFP